MRTTAILFSTWLAVFATSSADAQVRLIVESDRAAVAPDALRAALAQGAGVEVIGLDLSRAVQLEMMVDVGAESARVSYRTVDLPQGRVIDVPATEPLIERLVALVRGALGPPTSSAPAIIREWSGARRTTTAVLLAWPLDAVLGRFPESGTVLARPPPSR